MRLRLRTFMTVFLLLDRLGVHILPKHYYSPVPDYRWLRENKDLWIGRVSLAGVEWDLDSQLEWLQGLCMPYTNELEKLKASPRFGLIAAQVLHSFVRTYAPRRIIEVGSGFTTAYMVAASRMNSNPTSIIAIDPYPISLTEQQPISLIRKPVQAFSPDFFELEAGDLLFIDSTHAVKIGSDVVHLYLNVIPSLSPGVFIHIHDIYLPYVYPRGALEHIWGWQETALCLALLKWNPRIRVLCCESALHYDRPEELRRILPDYAPQLNRQEGLGGGRGMFPTSLWLQTS